MRDRWTKRDEGEPQRARFRPRFGVPAVLLALAGCGAEPGEVPYVPQAEVVLAREVTAVRQPTAPKDRVQEDVAYTLSARSGDGRRTLAQFAGTEYSPSVPEQNFAVARLCAWTRRDEVVWTAVSTYGRIDLRAFRPDHAQPDTIPPSGVLLSERYPGRVVSTHFEDRSEGPSLVVALEDEKLEFGPLAIQGARIVSRGDPLPPPLDFDLHVR